MKIIAFPVITIVTLIVTASTSHGALTLLINRDTKEIALVGSSSGTARDSGGIGSLALRYTPPDFPNFDAGSGTQRLSVSLYTTDGPGPTFDLVTNSGEFDMRVRFSAGGDYTITGTGIFTNLAVLDNFTFPGSTLPSDLLAAIPDGSIFTLTDGSGFDGGITVQSFQGVQSIPEPGSALLGFIGIILLSLRRRLVR